MTVDSIAHNYWTVDDDIVWAVVDQHSRSLRSVLTEEIGIARTRLDAQSDESGPG